ncbi:hypothetical protein CASFOL_040654 [Castilleja foliolosa]|uniref:DUF1985 domain-containing protein n=1 Tax=Castilleja foliolosa TaxID=1961234 RepID=A0ABD3BC72_9LAMI
MAMVTGGHYTLKLSQRSLLPQLIDLVEKNLVEEYLAKFKGSCLGHLLELADVKFQGQLIGQLLLCQDEVPSAEELVFNVHGKKATMGRLDFALVTGLSFGSYPVPPTKSVFRERVFGAVRGAIKIFDIEDKLKTKTKMKGEEETCLKLAMLYAVYGVLLAQSHSKKLDEKYINLADSFDALNNYPWGRVAFEYLKSRTHDIMKDKRRTLNEKKSNQFDVNGFFQALQVWAYEVLPHVGDVCAERVRPNETPRLRRWKTVDGIVTADELRKRCFPIVAPGDEGLAIGKLRPTKDESRSRYYTSVFKWKADLGNIVEGPSKLRDPDRRKDVRKGKRKAATDNETENYGPWEKESMLRRLRELEELVRWQQGRIKWLLTKTGYEGEVEEEELEKPQDHSADHRNSPSTYISEEIGNYVPTDEFADSLADPPADPPINAFTADRSADPPVNTETADLSADPPACPKKASAADTPSNTDTADHFADPPIASPADPPTNTETADLSADPTVDTQKADPPTNTETADLSADPTVDTQKADPPTNSSTTDPPADHTADPENVDPPSNPASPVDPLTNTETADLSADPTADTQKADPPTNSSSADPPADHTADPKITDPPSNPETVDPLADRSADPETADLAGNDSADLPADPSSALVVYEAVSVEPISVHNADSSVVTPDAPRGNKKKNKKGKEGDVVYETRKGNRLRKKGPATSSPFTDPDGQKKKKKAKTGV